MLSCGSYCCLHLDAQCRSYAQEWPCFWWVLALNFSEGCLPQLCLLVGAKTEEITSAAWTKLAHWNRNKLELTTGVQPLDLQGYCTVSLVQLLEICSAISSCTSGPCPYPAYFPLLRVLWKHSPYPNMFFNKAESYIFFFLLFLCRIFWKLPVHIIIRICFVSHCSVFSLPELHTPSSLSSHLSSPQIFHGSLHMYLTSLFYQELKTAFQKPTKALLVWTFSQVFSLIFAMLLLSTRILKNKQTTANKNGSFGCKWGEPVGFLENKN